MVSARGSQGQNTSQNPKHFPEYSGMCCFYSGMCLDSGKCLSLLATKHPFLFHKFLYVPDESVISPEVLGLGSTTRLLLQTSQTELEALFSKVQLGQLHF